MVVCVCSFYGFPGHYYKEKYPNVGSAEVAQKVIGAINDSGLKAEGVKRGLDHGVWASFKCGTYIPIPPSDMQCTRNWGKYGC